MTVAPASGCPCSLVTVPVRAIVLCGRPGAGRPAVGRAGRRCGLTAGRGLACIVTIARPGRVSAAGLGRGAAAGAARRLAVRIAGDAGAEGVTPLTTRLRATMTPVTYAGIKPSPPSTPCDFRRLFPFAVRRFASYLLKASTRGELRHLDGEGRTPRSICRGDTSCSPDYLTRPSVDNPHWTLAEVVAL